MLGLYVLGFSAAVVTARVLKSSVLKSGTHAFVLEMPPYRWPTVQSLGLRLLDRAQGLPAPRRHRDPAVTVVLWVSRVSRCTTASRPPIADSLAGTIGRTDRAGDQAARLQLEDRHRPDHIARRARGHRRHARHHLRHGPRSRSPPSLQAALRQDLTPGGAVALLVFFAFAMQCISTIAVVRRETGGWKWPIIQFTYMTALAYVGALAANQIITRLSA